MLSRIYNQVTDNIWEWNPQLFREFQGRLTQKSIMVVSLASILGQFLLYLYFEKMLPIEKGAYSRYCSNVSNVESYSTLSVCGKDLLGNLVIIKELWWLDLFITMSIMGVFILLVIGSYILVADVAKENSRQTLNFIRLTPQSAMTILGGKMLGSPILVYLFGILAIPLHLSAAFKAHISLPLILAFYIILGVSCLFFYTASLFFSFATSGLGSFQPWLVSMAIFFFLLTITGISMEADTFTSTSLDWIILFNPIMFLAYLVKSTFLSPSAIDYLSLEGLNHLNWYGNFLWQNSIFCFVFVLINYGVWSFWLWQGVKRRFHNPSATVISKYHSYLISACFIIFNLGFTLQDINVYSSENRQIILLQVINFLFFLLLITLLTPHRQSLQDWSRFCHENSDYSHNSFHDLLLGEKSPSPLAIAINISIVTLYTIPAVLIFPFNENKLSTLMGLILGGMMAIIYATIFQLLLMLKTQKRSLIATGIVMSLIISPFLAFIIHRQTIPSLWLFSAFPLTQMNLVSTYLVMGSFLTQIILIFGFNYQLNRVLNKAGMSETKALLTN